MATAGPNSPSAASGTSWSTPSNVYTSNNQYAAYSVQAFTISNALNVTNFGFSIPSNATIDGITVRIERAASAGSSLRDSLVKLLKAGTATGNDKADTGTLYTTSDVTKVYGSASDLWGTTWTYSNINASNFGVQYAVFGAHGSGYVTAYVDYVSITIDYTEASGQPMIARARAVPGMRRPHGHQGW